MAFWDMVSKPFGTATSLKSYRPCCISPVVACCLLFFSHLFFVCTSAVHGIVAERQHERPSPGSAATSVRREKVAAEHERQEQETRRRLR